MLLDVKLPGINGVETFLEMKKIRPSAQVMMMTGYSVEQLVAQAIEGGALGVLHKPFAAIQVSRSVDQGQAARSGARGRRRPRLRRQHRADPRRRRFRPGRRRDRAEALDKMIRRIPDCLMLDLRLPVLAGPEPYARLLDAGRAVPTSS